MTNKRDLKKAINYICSDLFAECVAASLYSSKDQKACDDLLAGVLLMHDDFVRRISHPEPGMPQKKYYRTLITDFHKEVSAVIDQISALA